jgi:DNA-binding response OmpR family regulator
MRLVLRVFLQRAGYRVSEAENKRQAIGLLLDLRPDMLVIDYEHPYLEPEAGKQIHEAIRPLSMPFIALIGRDLEHDFQRVLADVCLLKPLRMDELFNAISDLSQ